MVLRAILALIGALVGLLLAAPVVILWFVFESIAFLTTVGCRLFESRVISSNELVEFSPTIGWKPKPNLDAHYVTAVKDGVYHTVTDAQGWPDTVDIERSHVVVFGDSYAFGYGVDNRATFWRRNKEMVVKAIGAPGYNMVQEILLMKQLSRHLKDKVVIWFIYFGNDLYDNLTPNNRQYRTPFVRKPHQSNRWLVTTEHVSRTSWPGQADPQYYDRLAEICSATMLAERAYSACEFLIAEAQKICSEAGAKLVMMTVPDVIQLSAEGCEKLARLSPDRASFDVNLPDKKVKEVALRLGISMVALKDHLTADEYKTKDPHWNERGHQRVAHIIREVWNKISRQAGAVPISERVAKNYREAAGAL